MTKLRDFRIEFERPGATYTPGEIVSGKVLLSLSSSKNVREIRLEAKGEAEVHWTKSRTSKDSSGRSHTHTDHYRANEHYFRVSNRLIGGTGDTNTTLPAGQHSYPFSFHLPNNLPSSFEHEIGHIRYTVKAILDRPWRFDHKAVSAITVIASHDLNNVPANVTVGINDEINRQFTSCCCFNLGVAKINVRSRVSGFVPGETIELTVSYDNDSNRVDITKMKMQLEKRATFYATTPWSDKKYLTQVVRRVKENGPFNKKGERVLKFDVPPLPPSNLNNCTIIKIKYALVVKIGVSGMHRNISRAYPIELGTVPLYRPQNVSNASVTPYVPSAPPIEQVGVSAPLMPQPNQQIGFVVMNGPAPPYPTVVPPAMPDMPPPSYEECVFGSNSIADGNEQGMHGGNVQFAPKYPVYKFPMPTPYPP